MSCSVRGNKTLGNETMPPDTVQREAPHRLGETQRMQHPEWEAKSAECQKCGFVPSMFEAAFSQTLLNTGCGLEIGAFGFVLLPDLGKMLNRVPKRMVVEFVRMQVLGNHSPIEPVEPSNLSPAGAPNNTAGAHRRSGHATQGTRVLWDC